MRLRLPIWWRKTRSLVHCSLKSLQTLCICPILRWPATPGSAKRPWLVIFLCYAESFLRVILIHLLRIQTPISQIQQALQRITKWHLHHRRSVLSDAGNFLRVTLSHLLRIQTPIYQLQQALQPITKQHLHHPQAQYCKRVLSVILWPSPPHEYIFPIFSLLP